MSLIDRYARRFSYLRLSVTDACNFRCVYCLPNGYQKPPGQPEPLDVEEIRNLISGFAALGAWKVRITGGEPTLRRDLMEILEIARSTPGVRKVALSTNGARLKQLAPSLKSVGLDAVNVSVDSLNPVRFQELTGRDELSPILEGIDAALAVGISQVKINSVLMKGFNDADFDSFAEYVRERPISVRFIELMPTASNRALFEGHHIRATDIRERLLSRGWSLRGRREGDGPAEEFTHADYRGQMGVIAPYAKDFCGTCNRLRVTAQGGLRLCLFGEKDLSLRPLLRSASQRDELIAAVISNLELKDISHHLQRGIYGNNQTFSAMGG